MRYRTPEALGMAVTAAARKSGMDVGRAVTGFYFHRLLAVSSACLTRRSSLRADNRYLRGRRPPTRPATSTCSRKRQISTRRFLSFGDRPRSTWVTWSDSSSRAQSPLRQRTSTVRASKWHSSPCLAHGDSSSSRSTW